MSVRAIGIADADPGAVTAFVAECERRHLRTHTVPEGVAVAWSPDEAIGFAAHPDGSFVLLDGELFTDEPVADPAALVLAQLHAGLGLTGLHLEALVTWWDARAGQVTIARDHTGVVPGLVGRVGRTLVWSSEPADLLAAGVDPTPDPVAIDQLLTIGWVTPPSWYLRDVEALAAGHQAVAGPRGQYRVEAHHQPTTVPALEDDAAFGRAVTAAVARRARGGRLGAFLSAGVDSAMVVAVAHRTLGLPVETFTFRYGGYDGPFNEDAYAAETAAGLGVPHTVLPVEPTDLADRFADVVRSFQSPISFGIHSYLQDGITGLGVDVVLSGSDPGLWTDHARPGVLAARLRRLSPAAQLRAAAAARRTRGVPKLGLLSSATLLAAHGCPNEYLSPTQRRALFGGLPGADSLAAHLAAATHELDDEPASRRTGFVVQQLAVPEYVGLWNLRWARAHGHAIRCPLWDTDVTSVTNRRTDWSGPKPMLRRFAETVLPHDRAWAPKSSHEVPMAAWLRGPLRSLALDALSPARVAASGLFDPAAIASVLDDHLAERADHRWPIWTAMTAVEWALSIRHRPDPPLLKPS